VPRIADEEIERLKKEVPLEALVAASGVELGKAGADLVGRCPFHDDWEPSLVVSPGKNLWHCLGACQAGGSTIDWVMRSQGVSFRHAVELLREGKAGAQLPGPVPARSTVRRLYGRRYIGLINRPGSGLVAANVVVVSHHQGRLPEVMNNDTYASLGDVTVGAGGLGSGPSTAA